MKQYVLKQLQKLVVKYFQKHPEVKLIVATGSVGKSSTLRATADLLAQKYKIRMHESDDLTPELVPLAVLGLRIPTASDGALAWWKVLRAAKARVRQAADAEYILAELRVLRPGDMALYGSYLKPTIALVTAVSTERLDVFRTPDALAQEYMGISRYAAHTLINRDDIDAKYADLETTAEFSTYGTSGAAEYRFETEDMTLADGYVGSVISVNFAPFNAAIRVWGDHSLRSVVGGIAAAMRSGLAPDEIKKGLAFVRPLPGRMNLLLGYGDTTIIDDSYGANPQTVEAAIRTLYSCEEDTISSRVLVVSDFVGLGAFAQAEYERLGALCDPTLLTWVITVGPESAQYLAPAARLKGCQVRTAKHAIEAGEYVRAASQARMVSLVCGTAPWYLEETVKVLCNENQDAMLVRQDPESAAATQRHFEQFQ